MFIFYGKLNVFVLFFKAMKHTNNKKEKGETGGSIFILCWLTKAYFC